MNDADRKAARSQGLRVLFVSIISAIAERAKELMSGGFGVCTGFTHSQVKGEKRKVNGEEVMEMPFR